MVKTNAEKCPVLVLQGQVNHPGTRLTGRMNPDGQICYVPGTGGITLNAQIGDSCLGWVADHLEAGASVKNSTENFNNALITFSCIGNEAVVVSGDAKGAKGFVTGKHGGIDHVIIYFKKSDLEKMNIEDKIAVKSCGQGMQLVDYPNIVLRSCSPELIEKMNLQETEGGLKVGVRKIIDASIMGSGLGAVNSVSGDYDITLHDKEKLQEYNLGDLKFGDLVAIVNADTRFGYTYRTGSVTVGVVVHSDSNLAGHGPGVAVLMCSNEGALQPFVDEKANLADMFGVE